MMESDSICSLAVGPGGVMVVEVTSSGFVGSVDTTEVAGADDDSVDLNADAGLTGVCPEQPSSPTQNMLLATMRAASDECFRWTAGFIWSPLCVDIYGANVSYTSTPRCAAVIGLNDH